MPTITPILDELAVLRPNSNVYGFYCMVLFTTAVYKSRLPYRGPECDPVNRNDRKRETFNLD